MDHPFSRGLPDFGNYSPRPLFSSPSYPAQSPSYPQYDSRRPPTPPPTLPSIAVSGPFPIRSDAVRKFTPEEKIPAEDEIRMRDEKLATVKELKSPYDKAYACVQEFKAWYKGGSTSYSLEDYEEPHSIRMSRKDWAKLSSELGLGESDESYPRLSYNAFTETLIIQCMPSPVHQSIGAIIERQFSTAIANLPEDVQDQTQVMWEQDCKRFGGEWDGSGKRPDLAIQVLNARGRLEIKFVLEAGLSESYDHLVSDAELWLGGLSEVCMVALVKFVEVPAYHCPMAKHKDPREQGIPLDRNAIFSDEVALAGEYGPAIYKGLTWAGEISEAFLEIWVRGENGKAKQQGDRIDLKQAAQVEMDMGDFLPPGYPPKIRLNLKRFRSLLKLKIQELAAERCAAHVGDWKRKYVDVGSEYQP